MSAQRARLQRLQRLARSKIAIKFCPTIAAWHHHHRGSNPLRGSLHLLPQQQPALFRRAKGNSELLLPAPTKQASLRRVARLPNASIIFVISAISTKNICPTTAARHHYSRSSTKGAYTTLLGASAPAERAAGSEQSPTLANPPSSGRKRTNTLANPLATHQLQRDAQLPPPTYRGEAQDSKGANYAPRPPTNAAFARERQPHPAGATRPEP